MDSEQRSAMEKRVPKICPFCKNGDNIEWTEFKVNVGRMYYVDGKEVNNAWLSPTIQVFCTRCEEEVREEDLKGGK